MVGPAFFQAQLISRIARVHSVATFQNLLRWGCVDILRPSIGLNSIRQIRRMAAVAETHYVAVGPYHDGGPIGTVAAIHLAASLPNFFAQQVPQPLAEQDRTMRTELTSGNREVAEDGFAPLVNQYRYRAIRDVIKSPANQRESLDRQVFHWR